MFQFLVGAIKRKQKGGNMQVNLGFQFLVGAIKRR